MAAAKLAGFIFDLPCFVGGPQPVSGGSRRVVPPAFEVSARQNRKGRSDSHGPACKACFNCGQPGHVVTPVNMMDALPSRSRRIR
ncbi:hypothetical protein F9K79_19745 [Ochrobactrum sp. Kaboul]|nr:hypothetical protein F9K79_19745 [Ochrobactrum sp. Kaboul]